MNTDNNIPRMVELVVVDYSETFYRWKVEVIKSSTDVLESYQITVLEQGIRNDQPAGPAKDARTSRFLRLIEGGSYDSDVSLGLTPVDVTSVVGRIEVERAVANGRVFASVDSSSLDGGIVPKDTGVDSDLTLFNGQRLFYIDSTTEATCKVVFEVTLLHNCHSL